MCGILGAVGVGLDVSLPRFRACLRYLDHRGPDSGDVYVLRNLGFLGHRRLSIIDIGDASDQPFESACGTYVLVFNGEIYNYVELRKELELCGIQFRTASDTEVLLYALVQWGELALKKLEGMFAFALLDKSAKTIFCARDPFGIKPFFYSYDSSRLIFSSEILPVNALCGREEINNDAVVDFILDGSYDHSEQTFFSGVESLGAGEFIKYSIVSNKLSRRTWFAPSEIVLTDSYDAIVLQTRELLVDSVHKHLRADVPIALALSGGLDSSGVTGIVRHLLPNTEIQTFSYVPDDSSISEESWIDLAVSHNNLKSHKITFQQSSGIDDLIATLKAHQEPFGSSSMVAQYKVFESVKAAGIKVTLDGQGADELFCGYTGYLSNTIIGLLRQRRFGKLAKILKVAIDNKGVKFVLRAISMSGIQVLPYEVSNIIARYLYPNELLSCFRYDPRIGRRTSIPSIKMGSRGLRPSLNFATFEHGLPSLLRHADRSSMAHSIESRVPYLHVPLFKYISSIRDEFLFGDQNRPKGLLFDALEPFIPKPLYNRKDKVGFSADEWELVNNNANDILDHFDSNLNLPGIDVLAAKALVHKASKDKACYRPYHWRLIILALWATHCLEK